MSCCLPELEQFAAMDDMADWGAKHMRDVGAVLRKPTDPNGSNGEGSPFRDAIGMRNCIKCSKWRPQAGGGKNKRTGFWSCAGCLNPMKVPA